MDHRCSSRLAVRPLSHRGLAAETKAPLQPYEIPARSLSQLQTEKLWMPRWARGPRGLLAPDRVVCCHYRCGPLNWSTCRTGHFSRRICGLAYEPHVFLWRFFNVCVCEAGRARSESSARALIRGTGLFEWQRLALLSYALPQRRCLIKGVYKARTCSASSQGGRAGLRLRCRRGCT